MSPPVPNKPYGFCGRKAPRKKKNVTFQVSILWHRRTSVAFSSVCIVAQAHECRLPSQISLMVSVDIKHHKRRRLSPFKCILWHRRTSVAFSSVCIVAQAHEYCLPSLISLLVSVDVKHHERRREVSPFRCRYRGTGARVSPLLSVLWHRRTSVSFSSVYIVAQAHECHLSSV